MIRRPPRSTQSRSSAASDVYKRQMFDDSVSMWDPDRGAFAGRNVRQLPGGGHERGLRLPSRIFHQRMQRDVAHLVVQAGKAAQLVEHAVAPQELVRGGWQLVAVGAQFQFLLRTM